MTLSRLEGVAIDHSNAPSLGIIQNPSPKIFTTTETVLFGQALALADFAPSSAKKFHMSKLTS